jgi:ElaB/YqjD/DUF883 family membrane-anchored ribosome-binding protein
VQKRTTVPTIDNDLQQVIEELTELLRRSAAAYPTPQQRIRLKHLNARRTLLARVIVQRNKEHEEATR